MGIFDLFTEPIKNAFDMVESILDGEDVDTQKVAKIASTALTIATGAAVVDKGIEVISDLIQGEKE